MANVLPTGQTRIDHMEMRGIVKRFPGVLAVDQVDFDVRAGEVHALLGENGAGKSTLMKILYGLYQQNEGDVYVNGELVPIRSPSDAIERGIGMIHQHFMLVPSLTVAENVALGMKSSRGLLLDLSNMLLKLVESALVFLSLGRLILQLLILVRQFRNALLQLSLSLLVFGDTCLGLGVLPAEILNFTLQALPGLDVFGYPLFKLLLRLA